MNIGVLDDGLGGLTVARLLADRLPGHDLIYFGDSARGPYGDRSPALIERFAREGLAFLAAAGVGVVAVSGAVISACAGPALAAASAAGGGPVVITAEEALAAEAVTRSKRGLVGVVGEPALVAAGVYPDLVSRLRPGARVWQAACPLIPPLAAAGLLKKPESRLVVKKYLIPLKLRQADVLIAADAHYLPADALLARKITHRAPVVQFAEVLAGQMAAHVLAREPEAGAGRVGTRRFLVTDIGPTDAQAARRLYGLNLTLEMSTMNPGG